MFQFFSEYTFICFCSDALKKAGHRLTPDSSCVVFLHGLGHHSSSDLSSEDDDEEPEDGDASLLHGDSECNEEVIERSPCPYVQEEDWDDDWGSGDAGHQQTRDTDGCAGSQLNGDGDTGDGGAVHQQIEDDSCAQQTLDSEDLSTTVAAMANISFTDGAGECCGRDDGCENVEKNDLRSNAPVVYSGLNSAVTDGALESGSSAARSDSSLPREKDPAENRSSSIAAPADCTRSQPPIVPCLVDSTTAPPSETRESFSVGYSVTNPIANPPRHFNWGNTSQRALNDELCDLDTSSSVSGQFSDVEEEFAF